MPESSKLNSSCSPLLAQSRLASASAEEGDEAQLSPSDRALLILYSASWRVLGQRLAIPRKSPPNTGDKLRASNTLNARLLHPLVRLLVILSSEATEPNVV